MAKRKTDKPKEQNGPQGADNPRAAGAYILSLELENVRCFSERQTLDLTDGHGHPARWTILLGENGTGKTTILQALAGLQTNLDEFNHVPLAPEFELRNKIAQMVIFNGFARKPKVSYGGYVLIELEIAYGARSILDSMFDVYKYYLNRELYNFVQETGSASAARARLKCYAYGAGRRFSAGPVSLSKDLSEDTSSTLFDEAFSLDNPEEWLLQIDYSVSKLAAAGGRQGERLKQVKGLLIDILPDVTGVRFDAGTGVFPKAKVEFETPYGWVSLHQLGYGYRTMLAWVVDFTSRMVERYPDSPDPLAEPAVVLIDEIDLHLHPRWQRELIGFLSERFPNTQFIATAHSPLIVQAAIGANFALLRREGDHIVIDNDVEPMPGATVSQILTSDLFGLQSQRPPNLDKPLKRRKELLTKPRLTKADKKELEALEKQIGPLPTGETADEAEAMMLIEKTLRDLKDQMDKRP